MQPLFEITEYTKTRISIIPVLYYPKDEYFDKITLNRKEYEEWLSFSGKLDEEISYQDWDGEHIRDITQISPLVYWEYKEPEQIYQDLYQYITEVRSNPFVAIENAMKNILSAH